MHSPARRLTFVLLLLAACSEVTVVEDPERSVDAGRVDGGRNEAGHDAHDAHDAADAALGANVERLEIPVVVSDMHRYVPGAGVSVRIDGADGLSAEGVTDSAGVARFTLDRETAPWDVTVAQRGRGAVSILGLGASPVAPVHLPADLGADPAPDDREALTIGGAIVGRASGADTLLTLHGEAVLWYEDSGDSYRAGLRESLGVVRVLAVDHGAAPRDQPPISATLLEIDPARDDLENLDIVFAEPVSRELAMRLQLPAAGPLAELRDARAGKVYVRMGIERVLMGTSTATETDTPGLLAWSTRSVALANTPQWATLQLATADAGHLAEITLEPVEGALVTLPEYEALDVVERDGSLDLSWSAPGYTGVGASLQRDDNAVRPWFVYVAGEPPTSARSWPKLPAGLTLQDLGLSGALRANVFAYDSFGEVFWDWPVADAKVAVIRVHPVALGEP